MWMLLVNPELSTTPIKPQAHMHMNMAQVQTNHYFFIASLHYCITVFFEQLLKHPAHLLVCVITPVSQQHVAAHHLHQLIVAGGMLLAEVQQAYLTVAGWQRQQVGLTGPAGGHIMTYTHTGYDMLTVWRKTTC